MKHAALIVLCSALLFSLLSACNPADPLVGVWMSTETGTFDFRADGKLAVTITNSSSPEVGSWVRKSATELTLTSPDGKEVMQATYKIEGNTLTLTANGQDIKLTRGSLASAAEAAAAALANSAANAAGAVASNADSPTPEPVKDVDAFLNDYDKFADQYLDVAKKYKADSAANAEAYLTMSTKAIDYGLRAAYIESLSDAQSTKLTAITDKITQAGIQ